MVVTLISNLSFYSYWGVLRVRVNGKWRIVALAVLSATLLMGSSVSYAAESNTLAGTVVENRPDVAKIENQYVGYIDEERGTVYYNVSGHDGDSYWSAVVERKPDGSLSRWGEGFTWVSKGTPKDAPNVWIPYNVDMEFQPSYYDWTEDTVHEGPNFILSPNRKWAFIEQSYYLTVGDKRYVYWMRNVETGEIVEWNESYGNARAAWTADDRIILKRYSEKDRQNEIVTYDPASGKWERILLGTLYAYDIKSNLMVYVNNEPSRREMVYDLGTKKSRLLVDDTERGRLFAWSPPGYEQQPKLDANLDVWKLPVHPVAVVRDKLHTVHVDGKEIAVPYVFNRDGAQWIPMRELAQKLHWQVKLESAKDRAAAPRYRYTIQVGSRQIELTPDNSRIMNDRVFMTQAQLKTLGYSDITITSNR